MLGSCCFFGVGGDFSILIAIYQLMWEIGVCGDRILGVSIGGISTGCVRGMGGIKCAFIISLIFLLFLVFHCGDGVGGKFAISQ